VGDISMPDAAGDVPLAKAAGLGHTDIARLLLAAGASPAHRTGHRPNAVAVAAMAGHQETLAALLEAPDGVAAAGARDVFGRTTTHMAAASGISSALELLLAAGADGQAVTAGRESILIAAAKGGSVECVSLALDACGGRGVDDADLYGRTALWWAARRGHKEVVSALLSAGANASDGAFDSGSALDAAEAGGHKSVIAILSDGPAVTA